MRTTVDIDNDILQAARSIAKHENVTIGQALSQLARNGLMRTGTQTTRNGVPLLPRKPGDTSVVTLELVNRLRDEAP